jgi:HPt (histidine-containing phosphotransfer) domain-containing protein
MTGAREEYIAAGMNDYVSKPIDSAALMTRLARLPARVRRPMIKPVEAPAPQTAAPMPAAEGPVDQQKLEELSRYLPVSSVIDLLTLFVAESNGHAMRIKNYLAQKDYANIAREAHILVSTAGNIGAMQLSATARIVERACKDGKLDDFGRLVGELDRGISAASAAFQAWIDTQRTLAKTA